jgi:hypothetical protein
VICFPLRLGHVWHSITVSCFKDRRLRVCKSGQSRLLTHIESLGQRQNEQQKNVCGIKYRKRAWVEDVLNSCLAFRSFPQQLSVKTNGTRDPTTSHSIVHSWSPPSCRAVIRESLCNNFHKVTSYQQSETRHTAHRSYCEPLPRRLALRDAFRYVYAP